MADPRTLAKRKKKQSQRKKKYRAKEEGVSSEGRKPGGIALRTKKKYGQSHRDRKR